MKKLKEKKTWEERFDNALTQGEFDYYEDGKFCGILKNPLKSFISTELQSFRQQTAKEIFDMIYKWDDSDIVDEKEVFINKKSLLKVISQKYLKGHKEK